MIWRRKKYDVEELGEEFSARNFRVYRFEWEPRNIEGVSFIPHAPLSIEFTGGRGREVQARIVSADEGVIRSFEMAYEKQFGASFELANLDIPDLQVQGLLITLTTDRLYVFTKFTGLDESIWNHMLKILCRSDYFEAHMLITSNSAWIDYAEAFTHLAKRLAEGVEYTTLQFAGMKRFSDAPVPRFTTVKRKITYPIWATVGPAMARSAQEKIHGTPLVMSLDILIRGENAHSIMNSLSGVVSSWRSDWDYGTFIPVLWPEKDEVKRLKKQGFRVNEKLLQRIYYGVWRRFLLREPRIGARTWERLATLQGQFIDFYHPVPVVLDEIQAFLMLPNDPSLPVRYLRERRVEMYAFQDEEEGFEIGRVM